MISTGFLQRLRCALVLFPLVWLALALPAGASRRRAPIGSNLRRAAIVAVADSEFKADHSTVVTLREIIKGDPALAGKAYTIAPGTIASSADVRFPRNAEIFAILLPADWDSTIRNITELYLQPEQISALRTLKSIYDLKDEKSRLTTFADRALREAEKPETKLLQEQLWLDLGDMRESSNYSLLFSLYARADESQQARILTIIDSIGDSRGIPLLLQALAAPSRTLAVPAARALMYRFPGAPGVTAGFRKLLAQARDKEDWRWDTASSYLMSYDAEIADRAKRDKNVTVKARDAFKRGDKDTAFREVMNALRDPVSSMYLVRFDPDLIGFAIEEHPLSAPVIREALLPILNQFIAEDDYLKAADAAEVLGTFHSPEADPLLAQIIQKKTTWIYDDAVRSAAWTLFSKPETRELALKALETRPDWKGIQPVMTAAASPDPVPALNEILTPLAAKNSWLQNELATMRWATYWLGESRDQRAIPPLVTIVARGFDSQIAEKALPRFKGDAVNQALAPLLHSQNLGVRTAATNLLVARKGAAFLPELRRMLTEEGFGSARTAASLLGRVGTPEDIETLRPLADFWSGDRANHYWFTQAISEIRQRLGYDLNGRIPNAPPWAG